MGRKTSGRFAVRKAKTTWQRSEAREFAMPEAGVNQKARRHRHPGASVLLFFIRPISSLISRVRKDLLKNVSRIVVKFGTGVLTDSRKQLDLDQMEQLVGQVAAQRRAGKEIVVVSSGAVGAGMGALGYEKRPGQLAELQACAAVGQTRLMTTYEKLFANPNCVSRRSC